MQRTHRMEIHLSNGSIRKYTLDDILVIEEYPGRRWDETAVIFKDRSVFWAGCGCVKYVINAEKYITNDMVNTGGLTSSVKEEFEIKKLVNTWNLIDEFKVDSNLVDAIGELYEGDDYYYCWRNRKMTTENVWFDGKMRNVAIV